MTFVLRLHVSLRHATRFSKLRKRAVTREIRRIARRATFSAGISPLVILSRADGVRISSCAIRLQRRREDSASCIHRFHEGDPPRPDHHLHLALLDVAVSQTQVTHSEILTPSTRLRMTVDTSARNREFRESSRPGASWSAFGCGSAALCFLCASVPLW